MISAQTIRIIIEEIKNSVPEYATESDDLILKSLFVSVRKDMDGSLRSTRLTPTGIALMEDCFASYHVAMPEGYRVSSRDIIYLSKISKYPFFLDSEKAILFESDIAMLLKLSGDIKTLSGLNSANSD